MERLKKTIENLAIVERDGEVGNTRTCECSIDDLGRFRVSQSALCADGIEIALSEFTEAALCRAFATKDGTNRIALERHTKVVNVLGDKPRQGNGEIEPQRELARSATLVGHLEDLAEDLIGAGSLAGQDFHSLDVRCFDRQESEAGEYLAECGEHSLAGNHHRGSQVSQAAGYSGV